jgi:hypothetical protein
MLNTLTKFAGFITVCLLAWLLTSVSARGDSITINLPADLKVDKAVATTEKEPKASIDGEIRGATIGFTDPKPGLAYEVQLTLKDGTVLQGVDMGWYSRVPDKPNAEPITDDDKSQMTAVFTAGAQFFNVQQCTILKGNHNRAVMLVTEERMSKFHSDTGDEVIWRPELWYFENDHGGWEKVLQTDRVLRRERFTTEKDYHAVVDKLKWVPELGGLKATPKTPDVAVTLPANAGVARSSPTSQASVPPASGAGAAKP